MKSAIELYVSQKAKQSRNQRGWSIRYLADCLNVSHTFIENIESISSSKAYNLDHINALAKIFECEIYDLLPKFPLD